MAYLYQKVMDVPGLSGSWQDRLNTFGQKFYGSGYAGSYDQNIDLLNKINAGNYGSTPAPAAPKPKPAAAIKPAAITPFSKILPYDKIFNPNQINSLAESQINPEIRRQGEQARVGQDRGFAQSGAYRSGVAIGDRQRMVDSFERSRKEQVSQFTGNIDNALTDWYNRQSQTYYKNPSKFKSPTLPTFEQYANANNGGITDLYRAT